MSDFDWTPYEGGAAVAFNDPGDTVVGVVRDIEARAGNHGEVVVVTLLGDDGEEREVWCGAAVLRSEMARCAPQVGDKVKVTLLELRNVGKPSPMKVFEVKVARPKASEPEPAPPAYTDGEEPF